MIRTSRPVRPGSVSTTRRIRYSESMFFRRKRPRALNFEEHVRALRRAGFEVHAEPGGRVRVARGASAAVVEDAPGAAPRILVTGRLLRDDIARLVDGGFQKFWRTPDGHEAPTLAAHLGELHAFHEDLREALGLVSYYNTSLGTTNDWHLYDRVKKPGRLIRTAAPPQD